MSKFRAAAARFKDIEFPEWTVPVVIFAVCFFSFGVLLSRLGFFQDDWHHVFYAYWQGAQGLQRFLLADRGPFAWLIYAFFFRLLGFAPAAWHWSLMLIRFVAAFMFWLSVRQIWPGRSGLTGWLALLFAVYPIFTLQPLSVAYTLHWVMYLVFMISLYLMLRAIQHPRSYVLLTLSAVMLEALHLLFIEYFSGLELGRLVFLWLLLSEASPRERLARTFKNALPYLAVLALYVIYRSSYSVIFGSDRFTPLATMSDLVRAPLANLARIAQTILQDMVFVVFSQWYSAISPVIIDLSRPSTFLMFASMLVVGTLAYFTLSRLASVGARVESSALGPSLAVGGVVSIVLALLPFWLTGFSIFEKNLLWSERLALAAMPGASMLLTGTTYALVDRSLHRHLVLSVLLGLSVGLHFQTARNYQASWDKQEQFYWQLHWRAPALQPNTFVVSDQEILFYMGIYPTAFSLNLLFPQVTQPPIASYWFNAGSEHVNFDRFASGTPATFDKYATTFSATAQDVLAITFEPGQDQCLWILGPRHADVRALSPQASIWRGVSNPARILAGPETTPPPAIFGREPRHTWCYYFEKADLASQYQQWAAIPELWRQAGEQGMRAGNGIELIPFIAAYARLDDWDTAKKMTVQAQVLPDRSSSALCDLWRELQASTPSSAERDQAVADVEDQLGCQ